MVGCLSLLFKIDFLTNVFKHLFFAIESSQSTFKVKPALDGLPVKVNSFGSLLIILLSKGLCLNVSVIGVGY